MLGFVWSEIEIKDYYYGISTDPRDIMVLQ
jgi:hypothetical protein